MGDKKNIDRLFQECFKDFEATPSHAVWRNIETKLNQNEKERRIVPIWWQYAGVAALLAILLTLGSSYFSDTENTNPIQVVDTENSQTRGSKPANNIQITVENESINTANEAADKLKKIQEVPIRNTANKNTETSDFISGKKSNVKNTLTSENSNEIASVSEEKNEIKTSEEKQENSQNKSAFISIEEAKELISNSTKESPIVSTTEKKTVSIEEALEANRTDVKQQNNSNKWRITPNAAPVYFNSLGEGSTIDSQFNSNPKTGEVNMSYGLSASYAVNNKIKVRSGVNKVNLGYNTNNVVSYRSVGGNAGNQSLQNLKAVSGNNALENFSIISGENLTARPESFVTTNTSINQSLGYIEVPLEIQYALVNNKLGVNLIGGFSSFFLSDNKIYSETDSGSRTLLGEASNLNNVSYSANFGVGLNYEVSKIIDLNLEPMFKYQMNTFNNTSGDFSPYFIGVYTGFTIKF